MRSDTHKVSSEKSEKGGEINDNVHILHRVVSGHKQNNHKNKGIKNAHHVIIGTVAVGAVTVIELRHGSHILIEPFESASSFNEAVSDLMNLSDGGATGWLIWLAVVVGTIISCVKYSFMRVAQAWKGNARQEDE